MEQQESIVDNSNHKRLVFKPQSQILSSARGSHEVKLTLFLSQFKIDNQRHQGEAAYHGFSQPPVL